MWTLEFGKQRFEAGTVRLRINGLFASFSVTYLRVTKKGNV